MSQLHSYLYKREYFTLWSSYSMDHDSEPPLFHVTEIQIKKLVTILNKEHNKKYPKAAKDPWSYHPGSEPHCYNSIEEFLHDNREDTSDEEE